MPTTETHHLILRDMLRIEGALEDKAAEAHSPRVAAGFNETLSRVRDLIAKMEATRTAEGKRRSELPVVALHEAAAQAATRPATGRAALQLPPEQTIRPDRAF